MPTKLKKSQKLWGHISYDQGSIGEHWLYPEGGVVLAACSTHRINFNKYY